MGTLKAIADALIKAYYASPRFMAVMAFILALLLFLPTRVLSLVGAGPIVSRYHGYFGIAFLFFSGMTISYPLQRGGQWLELKIKKSSAHKSIAERLRKLDSRERSILKQYISSDLRSQYFYFNDGTVANLRHQRILFIPDIPGLMFDRERVPHVMNEWVWDYLQKHREIVEPPSGRSNPTPG